MWSSIDIGDRRDPIAIAALEQAMNKYHEKMHKREGEMEVVINEPAPAP